MSVLIPKLQPIRPYGFMLILVIGLCLRAIPLVEKQFFKGDEIRAYLAATGHEGEYRLLLRENQHPLKDWVAVSEWKRLVRPEQGIGLWAVAQDLAFWDVHPPLYFWVLHLWSQFFGVNFWSGALLNLSLELGILFVIMHLSNLHWQQHNVARLAGAVWWLDPTAIRVSPLVRSYVLLTLLGLLFVYALYHVFYTALPNRRPGIATFGLLVTMVLGLLTHYLFLFFIVAGLVALGLSHGMKQRQRIAKLFALLVFTLVAFILIYPDFFWAFTFLLEPRAEFWSHLLQRLARTFFVNGALYLPLVLCLLLVTGTYLFRQEKNALFFPIITIGQQRWQGLCRGQRFLLCLIAFASLPVLGTDLLFILSISPHHAMGAHYVNFATPLIALLVTACLTFFHRHSTKAPLLLLMLIVINLIQLHPAIRNFGIPPRLAATDLTTSGVIVFDNPATVHWFTLALHLPDDQTVFVASQSELLENPQQWLPRLQTVGGLYISFVISKNDPSRAKLEKSEQIVDLIHGRTKISLKKTLTPLGTSEMRIYQVSPSHKQ